MTQTSTRSILFRPPFSILEPGLISNHWSYWPFRVRGNGNYRSQLTFSVNCSVNMANSRWLTTVSSGMYLLNRQHFYIRCPAVTSKYVCIILSSIFLCMAFSENQSIWLSKSQKMIVLLYVFGFAGNCFQTTHYFFKGQAQFKSLSILHFKSIIAYVKG